MTATALAGARLEGGQSQQAFDWLRRALAEPGSIWTLPGMGSTNEVPAVAVLALALADVEVVVSVDDDTRHPLAETIRAATGATIGPIEDADLAILTVPDPARLRRCRRGSTLAPEEGAKVAIAVQALDDQHASGAISVAMEGPGVPGRRTLTVAGVDGALFDAIDEANRSFPAGIDCWFVTTDGRAAAIPRSTHFTTTKED